MSENTINAALRRLGFDKDEMTGHGFRSAASSMLNESGLWNPDVIERQLAHVDNDSIRRAYARADFWEERVRMMAWWAGRRANFAMQNLPQTGFVRLNAIIAPNGPIPVGRSTWWAGVKEGRFPKPVKLGLRITAWRVEDIRASIEKGA